MDADSCEVVAGRILSNWARLGKANGGIGGKMKGKFGGGTISRRKSGGSRVASARDACAYHCGNGVQRKSGITARAGSGTASSKVRFRSMSASAVNGVGGLGSDFPRDPVPSSEQFH